MVIFLRKKCKLYHKIIFLCYSIYQSEVIT